MSAVAFIKTGVTFNYFGLGLVHAQEGREWRLSNFRYLSAGTGSPGAPEVEMKPGSELPGEPDEVGPQFPSE